MPPMYYSRHLRRRGPSPACIKYSAEAWREHLEIPLQHDKIDEARLQDLQQLDLNHWSQEDAELWEEIQDRNEKREEAKCEPLRKELEGYFEHLNLPPLPPPLAKSSHWLQVTHPYNYQVKALRPFLISCKEGSLNDVKEWVQGKKDVLRHMGLQDGLACAASGNQTDISRYLLEEGGASLHGAAVESACRNRSLPLFKLYVKHGYHPNQQIPSNNGYFGTTLIHCLDNEDITRFLLENGADPNLAAFHDNRRSPWSHRGTPPLDRTSGLALDLAVKQDNSVVIQMLLEHGANPRYSRPLHGVISLCRNNRDTHPNEECDWQPLMEMLLQYGADIDASTYQWGTPLLMAATEKKWDVVEFLLERGADPKRMHPISGLDAYAVASQGVGIPWEETESVEKFLSYLHDSTTVSDAARTPPIPDIAQQNPLVSIIIRMRTKKAEEN